MVFMKDLHRKFALRKLRCAQDLEQELNPDVVRTRP